MNVHLIRCAIVMYSFLIIRAGDMFNTFLFLSVIKSLDHSVSVSCVDCMVACVKNARVSLLLIQYMYAVHRVTGQNVPPVSVKTSQCYRSKRPRESKRPTNQNVPRPWSKRPMWNNCRDNCSGHGMSTLLESDQQSSCSEDAVISSDPTWT